MRYFLTYILFISCAHTFSQINGYIFEAVTDEPVAGVTVYADENNYTVTDSTGFYKLDADTLPLLIHFSLLGYDPLKKVIMDDDKPLNVRLYISEINLSEVTVTSTAFRQKLNTVSGHISVITGKDIEPDNNTAINHSLNRLPGIFMQSATLSTNRLIIRGIGSRSPYSTNRVKAYFEEIPLTSGEGVTTIEDIDPALIGKLEIIRGPASGITGAGLGGAVNITSTGTSGSRNNAMLDYSAGSFGLHRISATAGFKGDNSNLAIGGNALYYKGYRENNETSRNSFYLFSQHRFMKSQLKLFLYNVNLLAHIPSSLNRVDYENEPVKAAANWLNIRGFEDYSKLLTGITYNHRLNHNFYNNTTIFASFFNQYESRPFNILKDKSLLYGLRSKFTYSSGNLSLAAGTEIFREHYQWNIYETLDGTQGNKLTDNDERRFYYNLYIQSKKDFSDKLTLTSGITLNNLVYKSFIQNLTDSVISNDMHSFKPVFSPMTGVNYKTSDALSVYLLFSHGFSPPSVEETLNPEGLKNKELKPESGWNIESGIRGVLADTRFYYELSVYGMFVKDMLVTKRLTEDVFTGINAGRTRHYGLEASFSYHINKEKNRSGNAIYSVSMSSYFTKNRFVSFIDDGTDFSGNFLPGIPDFIFHAGFNRIKEKGLNFTVNLQQTGSMFLNDANTGKINHFLLLNMKVIFRYSINNTFGIELFAGAYNLLNTHYASMVLVNAPEINNSLPRYYYPGLPLNINGGIKIRFEKQ